MNFNETNGSSGILNLSKGSILDLTKSNPSLNNVILAAGWDVNKSGSDNFDLDISAFLLDKNGRVTNIQEQVIYFNNKEVSGIKLNGDNRTGQGDGDDETININLSKISNDIKKIVFCVTIFEAISKRQTFGMVNNSYVRLLDIDKDNKELCRFELKNEYATSTAIVFAELFRSDNGWSFKAIGQGENVENLEKLLLKYM